MQIVRFSRAPWLRRVASAALTLLVAVGLAGISPGQAYAGAHGQHLFFYDGRSDVYFIVVHGHDQNGNVVTPHLTRVIQERYIGRNIGVLK
jgi:hypothetical protein